MSSSIVFTAAAYEKLMRTVGCEPPESGAVLGAAASQASVISQVWFDERAGTGQKVYKPSGAEIEAIVQAWSVSDDYFAGIVHSHTEGFPSLSPMDIRSAQAIMQANHMSSILLGLFHKGQLSMFRICKAPEGERPSVKELKVVVV